MSDDDEIILVSPTDEPIGLGKKLDIHQRGILHRAYSIFVINDDGEILLQKRSMKKYHSGGLWANSVCSHQYDGETLEESVHRRLDDELGIKDAPRATEIGHFMYYSKYSENMHEHEVDHVFICKYSGKIVPNPDEMSEVAWVDPGTLKQDLQDNPDKFASWFHTATVMVFEYLGIV